MDDRLQRMCALSDACALVSLMLDFKHLSEVCEGVGAGLVQQDMEGIASELGNYSVDDIFEWLPLVKESDVPEFYQAVRREHTRLFDDPDEPVCPYYEGAYINRRYRKEGRDAPDEDLLFINLAANDADRQYKKAGYRRAKDQNIPADCMITEMTFLSQLLLSAASDGTSEKTADKSFPHMLSSEEAHFCAQEYVRLHIRPWAEDFFTELGQESIVPYFKAVAQWGLLCVTEFRELYPEAFAKRGSHE